MSHPPPSPRHLPFPTPHPTYDRPPPQRHTPPHYQRPWPSQIPPLPSPPPLHSPPTSKSSASPTSKEKSSGWWIFKRGKRRSSETPGSARTGYMVEELTSGLGELDIRPRGRVDSGSTLGSEKDLPLVPTCNPESPPNPKPQRRPPILAARYQNLPSSTSQPNLSQPPPIPHRRPIPSSASLASFQNPPPRPETSTRQPGAPKTFEPGAPRPYRIPDRPFLPHHALTEPKAGAAGSDAARYGAALGLSDRARANSARPGNTPYTSPFSAQISSPKRSLDQSTPSTPIRTRASSPSKTPSTPAVRCAGYTQKGQPCKRLVKASAAYISLHAGSPTRGRGAQDGEDVVEARYCKDHAGKICGVEGFYWNSQKGGKGRWIRFADWIPEELEEQTKVLLRLTMESPLTPKESKGYIYAYELRDLQTPTLAYYKVGRTDNVPRRLDEWKKQCSSHHPTPRDIYPLSANTSSRKINPGTSMLPGAMYGGTAEGDMCLAVKRLERLIHLELAARSPVPTSSRTPCPDCSAIHKEIFPIEKEHGGEYELVVKPVILRWEGFIRAVMED